MASLPVNYNKILAVPSAGLKNPAAPKPEDNLALSFAQSSIQVGASGFFKLLDSSGADLLNATNALFAVAQDATFAQDLTVSGDTILAALSATNASFSGTLGVVGASTLGVLSAGATDVDSLAVDGNASVGGDLTVTGDITGADLSAAAGTFSGDVSVSGNLTVNGKVTTINSDQIMVHDPIMVLADGNVADTFDIGFVGKRVNAQNAQENVAFFYDQSAGEFAIANVGQTFGQDGSDNYQSLVVSSYMDLHLADLAAANADFSANVSITGTLSAGNTSVADLTAVDGTFSGSLWSVNATLSGNLVAVEGAFSGDLSADDITAASASLSGALSAASASISGNASVGGDLSVTGALSGSSGSFSGALSSASLSTGGITATSATISGALSAGATDVDSLAVDGNASVGGDLSVTGEISGADLTISGASSLASLDASGAVHFTSSADSISIDMATMQVTESHALDVDGGVHIDGHVYIAKTGGSLDMSAASISPDFAVAGKAAFMTDGGTAADPDFVVAGAAHFGALFMVEAEAAASIEVSNVADDAIAISSINDGHIHLDAAKLIRLSAVDGIATNHSANASGAVAANLAVSVNAQGEIVAVKANAKNTLALGVSLASIAGGSSAKGKVAEFGKVEISTESGANIALGDLLYLSASELGKVTNVPPTDADSTVYLMGVALAAPSNGKVSMALHRQFLYNN